MNTGTVYWYFSQCRDNLIKYKLIRDKLNIKYCRFHNVNNVLNNDITNDVIYSLNLFFNTLKVLSLWQQRIFIFNDSSTKLSLRGVLL